MILWKSQVFQIRASLRCVLCQWNGRVISQWQDKVPFFQQAGRSCFRKLHLESSARAEERVEGEETAGEFWSSPCNAGNEKKKHHEPLYLK